MNAYIQWADGQEQELKVLQPDPEDGTYTLFVQEGQSKVVLDDSGEVWIRIVPNE